MPAFLGVNFGMGVSIEKGSEVDMAKQRTITLHKDGFRTVWRNGPKGSQEIHVDVFKAAPDEVLPPDAKPVLEWAFPKIGGNALNRNAAIFFEQAIIYAKNPPDAKTSLEGIKVESA